MDEVLAIFSSKHCRNLKIFHSRLFRRKEHNLPTNHTKVFSTNSNFTASRTNPNIYGVKFHYLLSHQMNFNFSHKSIELIVNLLSHGLNYNYQACWTWMTLSTTYHYEMQKKFGVYTTLVCIGRNFIPVY